MKASFWICIKMISSSTGNAIGPATQKPSKFSDCHPALAYLNKKKPCRLILELTSSACHTRRPSDAADTPAA
jgi:hypothetical protein